MLFDKLQQIQDWPGVERCSFWMDRFYGPKTGMLDEEPRSWEVFEISVVKGGQLYRNRIFRDTEEHLLRLAYRPLAWPRRCEFAADEILHMLMMEEFRANGVIPPEEDGHANG